MAKDRIIVYVDGFNFYYGKKSKGWRKYYWLDIVPFFDQFMKENQELVEVHYFSAPSVENDKRTRQSAFFSSNKQNPRFNLHLGYYSVKDLVCFNCGDRIPRNEEKQTDVNIASQLIGNVVKNKCDMSILVSADSDLIPPLKLIRELSPKHKILSYFPPKRYSSELKNFSDYSIHLENYEARFKAHQLPDPVTLKNGAKLPRPLHWT